MYLGTYDSTTKKKNIPLKTVQLLQKKYFGSVNNVSGL